MPGHGEEEKDLGDNAANLTLRAVMRDNSSSVAASLSSYKELDDYEYYRSEMMKKSVERKYEQIIQNIEAKFKESYPQADDDDDNDSDMMMVMMMDEPKSEFFKFNRILKRHKKRLSKNLTQARPHHHH